MFFLKVTIGSGLNDDNGDRDVFIRDLISTTLISVNTNGAAGNGTSRDPVMTPDGRYVAFVNATDLVRMTGISDVFVRDRLTATDISECGCSTRRPRANHRRIGHAGHHTGRAICGILLHGH